MSVVRWSSLCSFAGYPWYHWCHPGIEYCPGSNVYVIEIDDDVYDCVGCCFKDSKFSEKGMAAHLRRHHEIGHHVPRILFDEEVIARAEAFWNLLGPDDRLEWVLRGDMIEREAWRLREKEFSKTLREIHGRK